MGKYLKMKEHEQEKGKATEFAHYIVTHCNIGENELFNILFAFYKDAWLLDIGATCHMTFQRDFFEYFSDNVDGIVYIVDKSSLKPSRIGIIMLKLLGFLNFLLHDVLYFLELWRILLYLVHIL